MKLKLPFATIVLMCFPAFGQWTNVRPAPIPRTADGKPNLQGIWQVRNTANWDVQSHGSAYRIPAGFGVVEGEAIPYQQWAAAKKQEIRVAKSSSKNNRKLGPWMRKNGAAK